MNKLEPRADQLIELGVASEETKGGDQQILDAMQTLERAGGISAD